MNNQCENTACRSHFVDGTCSDAMYLTSQTETIGNHEILNPLTRPQFSQLIDRYRSLLLRRNCSSDNLALLQALQYAENVLSQMSK